MPKSFFSSLPFVNELLSSPRIKPYLDRLQPAAVLGTMRGVLDDISGEMKSVASEWRMPDVPDLVEKIVTRLQLVVEDGPILSLDGRGRIHVPGNRQLASEIMQAMILSFDPSMGVDEATVEASLAREAGTEGAILFPSLDQAEMALIHAFCPRHCRALVARCDLREYETGRRAEELYRTMNVAIHEIGCCNRVTVNDYQTVLSKRIGLVRLARDGATLTPHFDQKQVKSLVESVEPFNIPVLLRLEYVSLVPLSGYFSRPIPTLEQVADLGVDLILCSTGQLMGGPECGLVLGKKCWLDKIRSSSTSLVFPTHYADAAGVGQTVQLSQNSEEAMLKIPILQAVGTGIANLENRAGRLIGQLSSVSSLDRVSSIQGLSLLSADASGVTQPTVLLQLLPARKTAEQLATALAKGNPALLARVEQNSLLIDLRTIPARFDAVLVELLARYASPSPN